MGHLPQVCRHMGTRPGGRRLTNPTPSSWERCWSTCREGQGEGFSLRKALFVRLHDELGDCRGRRPDRLRAGRGKRSGCIERSLIQ